MTNRFLEMDDYLQQNSRGSGQLYHTYAGSSYAPAAARAHFSHWAQPFAAVDRVLVILIENGGIDLGIPALVDMLLSAIPGASALPNSVRRQLIQYIERELRNLTDTLLESAALALNRYGSAKPDLFGDVIVLRDGTASYQELKSTLLSLSRTRKIVDLFILTHGNSDFISVAGGINSQKIRDMRTENGGPLSLRSVYMMNCVGSSLNQAWLDAGAKVAAGSLRNNYLPEPTNYFFWQNWKAGQTFENAVTSAYRRTINLMNAAVRTFLIALPFPGTSALAALVDLGTMDFVRDSAPVIQGQRSLTVTSDNLSSSQSVASGLATTVLPVSLLRTFSYGQSSAGASRQEGTVSQQGLEFIKSWEGQSNGQTDEQTSQVLTQKVQDIQQVVNDNVTVALNQNQNDALVCFVIGIGSRSFVRSTLLRLLNQGDYAAVPSELRKWTKVRRDGTLTDAPELIRRRSAEADLFQRPYSAAAQSLYRGWSEQAAYSIAQGPGDIPLDPGAGGQSIGENALSVGDIIVSTTNARVSHLIRWATNSVVSHAMIYIGDGQVVEAIGDGVTLRSLAQAVNDATVAVAFRHPTITNTQAQIVRDYVGQQIGRSYNYWGVVRQGGFQLDRQTYCANMTGAAYDRCVNWVGRVNLGRGDDDSFFCSQLVLAAYQHAGVPLTSTPPHWNSPDDLAQLGMARRLGYVGHLKALASTQSLAFNHANGARPTVTQTLAAPLSFNATEWERLISFRPPVAIQSAVKGKGVNWHVHRIEAANGDINLDYYPVTVTRLPKIGGRTVSAEELLSHIRLNINRFVDTNVSEFTPYDSGEASVWGSSAPLGSVVHIDMKSAHGWLNLDDGSVVASEFAPDHWIFSTIWTVQDGAHPVSGNRQFGFTPADGGSYIFYTRGADRATGVLDMAARSIIFAAAHNLWLSLQQGIASFVNGSDGSARVDTATSIRTPWPAIQSAYHHPTVGWV